MGNINTMAHLLLWKGGLLAIKFCSYYIGTLAVSSVTESTEKPVNITINNNLGKTEVRSEKDINEIHENYKDEDDEDSIKVIKKKERKERQEKDSGDEESIEIKKKEHEERKEDIEDNTEENDSIENTKEDKNKNKEVDVAEQQKEIRPVSTSGKIVKVSNNNNPRMIIGTPNVVVQKKKYVNL